MAEEEKNQSPESQADKAKEDYETKYKQMQAKYQQDVERLNQEIESNKQMLDAVTPFVDWEAAQGKKKESFESTEYLDRKSIEEMRARDNEMAENRLLELQFKVDNPDLKNEIDLVKVKLSDLRIKHPRTNKVKLLEMAAEETRNHIKAIKESALAEMKKTQAEKEEAEAAGLESQGGTTPEQEQKGQTNEEYFAERKARLQTKKGQQLLKM